MNEKRISVCIVLALCLALTGIGTSKEIVVADPGGAAGKNTPAANPGGGNDKDAPGGIPGQADDRTLVGWWQLDDDFGDSASDASPGQQHGKLKGGPKWTKGARGGALELDGRDDYVAITKAFFNRSDLEAVTVAAWVRTNSSKRQVVASFDRDEYWELDVSGAFGKNGRVGWSLFTDAGSINLTGNTRVNDGQWHHVAGVFENGQATVYVDGAKDGTTTKGQTFGSGNKRYGFLGIGSRANRYDGDTVAGTNFSGDMDDVRIYSRALTAGEIAELAFFGPANDDSQFAEPITEVSNLPFDTTDATFDGQGVFIRSPNLWYLYAPSATGVATLSLQGSQYDTMVAVYRGAEVDPGWDRLIAANDDYYGLQSRVTFDVVSGTVYLIEIGGFGRATGQGVLTITLQSISPALRDLGDAPTSVIRQMTAYPNTGQGAVVANFPTVFGNLTGRPRGPVHLEPQAVAYLGQTVTLENEVDKGPDEDGVNNINPSQDRADRDGGDDGVILPLVLPDGEFTDFEYTVTVVEPGRNLWVNVWFDWNRDGDWDDDSVGVPEWAVRNQFLFSLPAGTHQITTPAFRARSPLKDAENIWMRITLSEMPWTGGTHPGALGNGGSGPADGYEIGETEDYLIVPEPAPCPLCQDWNGDGQQNFDDLVALIYQWLDCCAQ